jgi:hypothetical protein
MPDNRPSFPFPARYDGGCAAECGHRVHPGDMVQFVEGQLVHVGCIPDEEPEPRPVCPVCWLEQSVNGSCGCPT